MVQFNHVTASVNHSTALVSDLLPAHADARRELAEARQEVVDLRLQMAADQITLLAAIRPDSDRKDAVLRAEFNARLLAN